MTRTDTQQENRVPPQLADIWMTIPEACEELKMSRDTITRKVRSRVLVKMKYGKYVFISRDSVKRYLDQFRHVSHS